VPIPFCNAGLRAFHWLEPHSSKGSRAVSPVKQSLVNHSNAGAQHEGPNATNAGGSIACIGCVAAPALHVLQLQGDVGQLCEWGICRREGLVSLRERQTETAMQPKRVFLCCVLAASSMLLMRTMQQEHRLHVTWGMLHARYTQMQRLHAHAAHCTSISMLCIVLASTHCSWDCCCHTAAAVSPLTLIHTCLDSSTRP
jgi:hypothetical protein